MSPKQLSKSLDHLGIAVQDLKQGKKLFARLLGQVPQHEEQVLAAGVEVAFFDLGALHIELVAPLSQASAVGRFLAKRGEGLHHMAFGVLDLESAREAMEAEGFAALTNEPQQGAKNKHTYFFDPKTTGGVLVEICSPAKASPSNS